MHTFAELALSLLYIGGMKQHLPVTPEHLSRTIEAYFAERQAAILPSGEQTTDGKQLSWCGEVLEYLTEGLAERLAGRGITFSKAFPGPFRLMDEDQMADGQHVRRFWTMALDHGCPIARLCTIFFHRHDNVTLPQPPRVMAYPPDHPEPHMEEPA
ncbi:MAG: hypothetical protein Q7U39_05845 [Nitrospira sp.]|nr:hypothetical protein [Nitrospira sp.]